VGSKFPVSISNESVPSATLASKTACFFILNANTVLFVPLTLGYVLLIDSHLHDQTGAFVALCEMQDIHEF